MILYVDGLRVRVRVRVPWAYLIIRIIGGLGILSVEYRSEQILPVALAASKICGACIIRVRVRVRIRIRIRIRVSTFNSKRFVLM